MAEPNPILTRLTLLNFTVPDCVVSTAQGWCLNQLLILSVHFYQNRIPVQVVGNVNTTLDTGLHEPTTMDGNSLVGIQLNVHERDAHTGKLVTHIELSIC